MAHPFVRRRDGTIRARLSEVEVAIVRRLAHDVAEIVDERTDATRRLFPPAYPDDVEREQSFRAMTEEELVRLKKAAAQRVITSLEEATSARGDTELRLDDDAAHAWLGVLNDARLVLGTRLEVTEDMDHAPLPEADPRAPSFNMYLYLGALQEALLEEMRPR